MNNTSLRFAPFIRVSTEKQAEQGRSLSDQKAAIISYVNQLNGIIPESCWRYIGQESALPNPDTEKRMFNLLLHDAEKGAFDCVIVQHADRLSRDNEQLKRALRIFRSANIKFFVQTTEKDLYNPQDCFELGLTAEFSEFVALQYAKKSIVARIASAKEQAIKGIAPKNLCLPFARYQQKDGSWGLDESKADLIRAAVELYLSEQGSGIEKVAKVVGIHYMTLYRCFKLNLGDTWKREFNSKKFNITESVTYTIPAIINDYNKIQAVLDKLQHNKKHTHSNKKHEYLLSKFVLCGVCGSAFSGVTPSRGSKRYYVHLDKGRSACIHAKPCACVDGRLLEQIVLAELEDMLLSTEAIETKVKEYTNPPAIMEKKRTLSLLENEQRQLKAEIQRLMSAYAKGLFTDDEVQPMIAEKRSRGNVLDTEIVKLQHELASTPTEETIRQRANNITKAMSKKIKESIEANYRQDRKLIESIFSGRDSLGRRMGVYLTKEDGKWFYELRGNLPWVNQQGELHSAHTACMLGLDTSQTKYHASIPQ